MTVSVSIQILYDHSQWLRLENHFPSLPREHLVGIHRPGRTPPCVGRIGDLLSLSKHLVRGSGSILRGNLDGMLQHGDRDKIIARLYDELCTQGSSVGALTSDGKGSRRIRCHNERRFAPEQMDLTPLWREHHVECGVRIQYDLAAVVKHNLLLLSDCGPMLSCLET